MSKRKNTARATPASPESIMPLTDFRADPWGTGDRNAVAFRAGIRSSPVPADFAQKMRDQGKAEKRGIESPADGVMRAASLGSRKAAPAKPAEKPAPTGGDQPAKD